MIEENVEAGRDVYIVGAQGQTWKRLQDLGVTSVIPASNILSNRAKALRSALERIEKKQQAQDVANMAASAN
jgi:SulP family sulfate permease